VKYLFLLYQNEKAAPAPGSAEMQQQLQAYGAFYEDVSRRGLFQSGDPVQGSQTATTVRVRDGKTDATSGPFSNSAEQIIGFYVLDCKDQAEAVACAANIPAAGTGAVEVRPILVM
jgi:hypothetical protein